MPRGRPRRNDPSRIKTAPVVEAPPPEPPPKYPPLARPAHSFGQHMRTWSEAVDRARHATRDIDSRLP
jgi:hypothetical protein